MQHYNFFNKAILKPIEQSGYMGAGARAMRDLRGNVLNVMAAPRPKNTVGF